MERLSGKLEPFATPQLDIPPQLSQMESDRARARDQYLVEGVSMSGVRFVGSVAPLADNESFACQPVRERVGGSTVHALVT